MDGLAGTFDRDAAGYAAGRPGYPETLFEALAGRCGLRPGAGVLEIGPGTGQATAELLRRGAEVTAVEPGSNLAAHLVETLRSDSLRVIVDTFERARLEPASADLVVSATAFHWIDPEVGLDKVMTLLRPGGWIALCWNVFFDPDAPDAFSEAFDPIFSAFQEAEEKHSSADAMDEEVWIGRLRGAGFLDPAVEHLRWETQYRSEDLVALYSTYSNVRSLPTPDRERFFEAIRDVTDDTFDGRVTRRYVTVLYTGSKAEQGPAQR